MSFEEEFDKIIRQKAESENYAFDQNNWEKVSDLLDADKKGAYISTLKRFYVPALVTLILGSAGLFTFMYLKEDASKEIVSQTMANPKINDAVISENKTQEKQLNSNISSINEASTKNTKLSDKLKSSDDVVSQAVSNIPQVLETPAKTENVVAKTKFSDNTRTNPSTNIINVIQNTGSEVRVNDASDQKIVTQEVPVTSSKANDDNSSDANNLGLASSIVPTNSSDNTKPVETDSKLKEGKTIEQKVLFTQEQDIAADRLTAVYSTLPYEIQEFEIIPTPFNSLKRYDDEYYKNNTPPKKHYLNAELGGNYLLGWDTKSGKDGNGFNWFLGLNYGSYLTKKLSVSAGIQAYTLGNINQPFYSVNHKEYSFGSVNIYTVVTCNQLYYAAIPIRLNYSINSSNIIGLGFNAGYLIGASNTIETYSQISDGSKTLLAAPTKNKGIYEGIASANMIASAHYKIQLNKRIGLNAEFNYGLTDLFLNKNNTGNLEKPMGLRLSLHYTLFDN